MKQEKTIIMQKFDQYDNKIKDQRNQLREAQELIKRLKHVAKQEEGENKQETIEKLLKAEKSLGELKQMYLKICGEKELLKKDIIFMQKKNKRNKTKISTQDQTIRDMQQQMLKMKRKFK